MCTWDCHFSLQNEGWLEHPLWCSAQSDYLCSGYQVHAHTFLPKVGMTSLKHCLVTYQWCGGLGWWHSCHNCIRVRGIKGWIQGWRASQFCDFRCRAYRTKLIPSRVLWCAPTSGQPGNLYLLTTKRCSVYWLLLISDFLWSNILFYWLWLFEWPSNQWAQLKGLEYLAARTAILIRDWKKRDQGVPGCPPLS